MYDHLVNIYSTRTVALFIGTQADFYRVPGLDLGRERLLYR